MQQPTSSGAPPQAPDQISATSMPPGASPGVSYANPGGGGAGGAFNQDLSRQLTDLRQGFSFGNFMTFRFMITPPLITIIYIVAVIGITLGSLALLTQNALVAIVSWVFVMLWVRVIFEVMIVLFRINDGVQTVARRQ